MVLVNTGSTQLIGRDAELTVLRDTIASPPRGQVIVISGALGSGKTSLLVAAERQADALGHRVLGIAGLPGETGTPLGGLHRLLRALNDAEANPYGRANIIETLFSTPLFGDQIHTARLATALLELLDAVPRRQPVLVTVDDAHWLDEQSRSVLLFAARRSAGRPITVALTLPDTVAATGLAGRSAVEIPLAPMTLDQSIELLEAQPTPPSGLLREQILKQSAGNPAAIIHFSSTTAGATPTAGYTPDPLPLPISVHAIYAQHLAHLPPSTRAALVVVAAASAADLHGLHPGAVADPAVLAPAETAGVLRVESARINPVNPLIRSAAYYGAPLTARQDAHQLLADALNALPQRQTWHRAHAASSATGSPHDRIRALTAHGMTTMWHNGRAAAVTLLTAADEALRLDPALAWEPLRVAAAAAFLSGDPSAYRDTAKALQRLDDSMPVTAGGSSTSRLWVRAVTDSPRTQADMASFSSRPIEGLGVLDLSLIGLAAGVTDESELSIRTLRIAQSLMTQHDSTNGHALTTTVLAWSCVDTGRWDEALRITSQLHTLGAVSDQPLVTATGDLIRATVATRRGDTAAARVQLTAALNVLDFQDNRLHSAQAHHVLGLINIVEGNDLGAYGHLAELFTTSGVPLHPHVSFRALADFAEAAARTGMADDARRRFTAALTHLPQPRSARLDQLLNHAAALLNVGDVGDALARTLADPAGEQWPFERARLRLTYSGWLRRSRRRKEARQHISAALATFEKLGAKPWLEICARELRASGVPTTAPAIPSTGQLSPQEHQVVYLAGRGLTNPQIAARLQLSTRTVSGYLYRSFPKLGVTSRHQIRDIPPPPDTFPQSQGFG
ncbi:AAA family ATPase [Mycolicibacterium llatzerense]|uniref:AAA family ATPase n=1 Tax=Mycolicibacterium llatzerense TaxID=280871 RepID=UPI0008DD5EF0|nr:LuxR family transcriptional regulator [Mycolicibacterium llatzerense]